MSRGQRCDVSSPGGAATNGPPGRLHIALTQPAYARALLHGAANRVGRRWMRSALWAPRLGHQPRQRPPLSQQDPGTRHDAGA